MPCNFEGMYRWALLLARGFLCVGGMKDLLCESLWQESGIEHTELVEWQ